MNADAVAALLHDVLGAECSGTHSLGYATCQRQAAALAAAPLPSEPTHPHDGFAYDGCKCVCCVNIRALANPAIIEERDRAEEWADRLAYAIGGAAIGEHSNLNNPWQNALDMAAPLPSDTPADGLRETLVAHYVTAIECDHDAKTDTIRCVCSVWTGTPQPSVGKAVEQWADHVLAALDGPRPAGPWTGDPADYDGDEGR